MSGYRARARYYDLEFDTHEDFSLIGAIVPQSGLVLDIPCGTGRLLPLYESIDNSVLMVDIESAMTAGCRERIDRMGMQGRVEVLTADMRSLRLAQRAATVLVAHGGLQMLRSGEDVDRALHSLANCVGPGGLMYVDVADPWGVDPSLRSRLAPFMALEEINGVQVKSAGGLTMTRTWFSHVAEREWRVEFSYSVSNSSGAKIDEYEATSIWLRLSKEALMTTLRSAGIEVVRSLGDYDGRPYTEGSPRLILVGRSTDV